jgi:2-polyprenyl-3-methyl-5-hydroxy-6-metoxy-1,4-benzoquinol methylase
MSFFPHDAGAPVVEAGPLIEWEEPGCLLCGSQHWSPLVEAPDSTAGGTGLWFAVVQCQDCGLCFTCPRPNLETIGQFYPAVYRPHHTRRSRAVRREQGQQSWQHGGRRRNDASSLFQSEINAHPLRSTGRGRLLDFGCGGGAFLAQMHSQNWQVTGLDISAAAVQRVRDELGLRAVVGSLPHPDLRPGSFDVITMWHSLEHVHAPLEVLRQAHRLLVPGGRLVVAVPNIDSLPFRWFGSAWYGLDLPRHLTHFAPWTLQAMLERAGFRAGPIRMIRHSDWLRASAKLAGRSGGAYRWQPWLRTKFFSQLASWYCHWTRQTDCIMATAER